MGGRKGYERIKQETPRAVVPPHLFLITVVEIRLRKIRFSSCVCLLSHTVVTHTTSDTRCHLGDLDGSLATGWLVND